MTGQDTINGNKTITNTCHIDCILLKTYYAYDSLLNCMRSMLVIT